MVPQSSEDVTALRDVALREAGEIEAVNHSVDLVQGGERLPQLLIGELGSGLRVAAAPSMVTSGHLSMRALSLIEAGECYKRPRLLRSD